MAHFVTFNMQNPRSSTVVGTLVVALLVVSCESDGGYGEFAGYTPHERYEHGLRTAGLDVTALGRDWLAAANHALEAPVVISPPYSEVSFLDVGEAGAVGYKVSLVRGQTVTASFELDGDTAYNVFLDMFVMPTGARTRPVLLTSADSNSHELEYVARRDGDYIVRRAGQRVKKEFHTLR